MELQRSNCNIASDHIIANTVFWGDEYTVGCKMYEMEVEWKKLYIRLALIEI